MRFLNFFFVIIASILFVILTPFTIHAICADSFERVSSSENTVTKNIGARVPSSGAKKSSNTVFAHDSAETLADVISLAKDPNIEVFEINVFEGMQRDVIAQLLKVLTSAQREDLLYKLKIRLIAQPYHVNDDNYGYGVTDLIINARLLEYIEQDYPGVTVEFAILNQGDVLLTDLDGDEHDGRLRQIIKDRLKRLNSSPESRDVLYTYNQTWHQEQASLSGMYAEDRDRIDEIKQYLKGLIEAYIHD